MGTPPVAMAGHSQGILGVESLKAKGTRDAELLALLQLIGAAGSLVSRRRGMVGRGDKTPMVSVTNVDPDRIAELLEEFSTDVRTVLPPVLSIRNGRRSVVITGTPEQLGRFELYCSQDHREGRSRAQEQAARRRGVLAGVQPGAGRGRLPHPAPGRRRRARRPLGRPVRYRRRAGAHHDRVHLRQPDRLGRRRRGPAQRGRPLDHRPRPGRHRHPSDRAGHPRPRHRHRAGRHPRRPAQPVHRRRRARGARAVDQLRAVRRSPCPTAR